MVKFKMRLDGKKVGDKRIPIDIFGKYLLALNNFIMDVSKGVEKIPTNPKKKKIFFEGRQLFLTGISSGSTVAQIEGPSQTTLGAQNGLMDVLNKGFEILDLIQFQGLDEDQTLNELAKKVTDRVHLVHILNDCKTMWADSGINVQFEGINSFYKNDMFRINLVFRKKINSILNKELNIAVESIEGLITRIKGDGKRKYFTMITTSGNKIECDFTTENENEIISRFKTPVKIKGQVSTTKTKRRIKKMYDIKDLDHISITPNDFPTLTDSIKLFLEYDREDEFYHGFNDELNLHAFGDTINGLKDSAIEDLEFLIDSFIIQEHGMTEDLKDVIEALKKKIDINKFNIDKHYKLMEDA